MKTIFVLLLSPFYCGGPQLIGPTVHIKPIFFLFFARNNWSYLLCPPAIVVTQPRGHIVSTPLRGTTENRTYGTHNDLRISLFSLTTFGLIYYAPLPTTSGSCLGVLYIEEIVNSPSFHRRPACTCACLPTLGALRSCINLCFL